VLIVAGLVAWFQMGQREDDSAAVLEKFANKYADSVAFLVTEYWLGGHHAFSDCRISQIK
jgi:hypothetical protein